MSDGARPRWRDNDRLFLAELAEGHRVATALGRELARAGLEVAVTPMEIRRDLHDAERFSDEHDLTANGRRLDVKSTSYPWAPGAPFPFARPYVDTVAGWEAKAHKPAAVILVGQRELATAVVPASTYPRWTTRRALDRVRGITETFYCTRREDLRPLGELIAWLRAR